MSFGVPLTTKITKGNNLIGVSYMPARGMHPIATDFQDWCESYASNSNQDVCINNNKWARPFCPLLGGTRYRKQYYPTCWNFLHSRRWYFPPYSRVYSPPQSREFLLGPTIMEDEEALPIGLMLEKGLLVYQLQNWNNYTTMQYVSKKKPLQKKKKKSKAMFNLGKLHLN